MSETPLSRTSATENRHKVPTKRFNAWLLTVIIPSVFLLPLAMLSWLQAIDEPRWLRAAVFILAVVLQAVATIVMSIWGVQLLRATAASTQASSRAQDVPDFAWRLGMRRFSARAARYLVGVVLVFGLVGPAASWPVGLRIFFVVAAIVVVISALWQMYRIRDEESDELELQVERGAERFTLVGILTVTCGVDLLGRTGLMQNFRWGFFHICGLIIALHLVGSFLTSRRYR